MKDTGTCDRPEHEEDARSPFLGPGSGTLGGGGMAMTYTRPRDPGSRRTAGPCVAVALAAMVTASCASLIGLETPEIALADMIPE